MEAVKHSKGDSMDYIAKPFWWTLCLREMKYKTKRSFGSSGDGMDHNAQFRVMNLYKPATIAR